MIKIMKKQTNIYSEFSLCHHQPEPRPRMPVFYPSPGVSRPANQLSEDEQIKIAQRLGLIGHLPTGKYDGASKKTTE